MGKYSLALVCILPSRGKDVLRKRAQSNAETQKRGQMSTSSKIFVFLCGAKPGQLCVHDRDFRGLRKCSSSVDRRRQC